MIRPRRPKARPSLESLESRLVLSAPAQVPGSPMQLPDEGEWRSTVFVGSPIFSDLDGDGKDEIIGPASGGKLVAYRAGANGQMELFRRYETGSRTNVKATPVVVTRPDGRKILVAGVGREESRAGGAIEDGRLFAFDAQAGSLLWVRETGQSVPDAVGIPFKGVSAAIATGDLDLDGVPEIVVSTSADYVIAYRLDGSELWRYDSDDDVHSGPVVGDIDRDGLPEVVFGGETNANGFFESGGHINILNHNGSAKYRYRVGESIWSSPVLVDLNNDGTLEIVVGTGLTHVLATPNDATRAASNQVTAIDYQGRAVPGWPYRTAGASERRAVVSSPAVADLNGDGSFEVAVVDFLGYVHVIQANGQPFPGFEGGRQLRPQGVSPEGSYPSPVIADINGDGSPDIISATGPVIAAFDNRGNRLFFDTTPTPGINSIDQYFATPAIGQFDGVGGLELAFLSNRGTADRNPPSTIKMYALPQSSLAPPWPMQRKDAAAHAITYTPDFLRKYISATLLALVGRNATENDIAVFSRMIQGQEFTIRSFAEAVARTPESRALVTRRLYSDYLDRAATDDEVNAGIALLGSNPASVLGKSLLLSARFAELAGGIPAGIALRMFRVVLDRDPDASERAYYIDPVASGAITPGQLADMLVRREDFLLKDIIAPVIIAYRNYFPGSNGGMVDPGAIGAVLLDSANGVREDEMRARLVFSGENYAATNATAGWVRSLARDVEGREMGSDELASVLRAFAERRITEDQYARALVHSNAGRERFIRQRTRALLGREADPGLVAAFISYPERDAVSLAIVLSPEYYARNGNNNTGYVIALFRDLTGFQQTAQGVAPFVQRLNGFTQVVGGRRVVVPPEPRVNIALEILKSNIAYSQRIIDLLFEYIPREDLGVLATANNHPASGRVNPDPNLINGLIGWRQSGITEDELLVRLLLTGDYKAKAAFYRGSYQRVGVRA